MTVDPTTDDDASAARWMAAQNLARGGQPARPSSPLRRHYGKIMLVLTAGVLLAGLALIATVLIALLTSEHDGDDVGDLLGSAFTGVGFMVLAFSAGSMFVGPRKLNFARWAGSPLNQAERVSAQRQIRAKDPVRPEHLLVLRAMAEFTVKQRYLLVPLLCGFGLLGIGQIMSNPDMWPVWVSILVVLTPAVGGIGLWEHRHAARFLAANPPVTT